MTKKNISSRRAFLRKAAIAATFPFVASSCAFEKTKFTQPNVILIIGDDISVDDFGCYGHRHIRTPNVDKLAANGIRFTNAYLTTSQCSPTRCSIITGRYPHNTGAPELHTALPKGQIMFSAVLKQAGYYTAAAGKWHMGNYAKSAFDKVVGGGLGGSDAPLQYHEGLGLVQTIFVLHADHGALDDVGVGLEALFYFQR